MTTKAVQFTETSGGKYAMMNEGPTTDGHATVIPVHGIDQVTENANEVVIKTAPLKAPAEATGSCTAAYAVAVNWTGLQSIPNKTIIVANTDAALTMKYRIRGYAKSGSSYYNEIQAEKTLAASTMQPHVIQNHYDVITVEVVDGTGHATYAIDYAGGP